MNLTTFCILKLNYDFIKKINFTQVYFILFVELICQNIKQLQELLPIYRNINYIEVTYPLNAVVNNNNKSSRRSLRRFYDSRQHTIAYKSRSYICCEVLLCPLYRYGTSQHFKSILDKSACSAWIQLQYYKFTMGDIVVARLTALTRSTKILLYCLYDDLLVAFLYRCSYTIYHLNFLILTISN